MFGVYAACNSLFLQKWDPTYCFTTCFVFSKNFIMNASLVTLILYIYVFFFVINNSTAGLFMDGSSFHSFDVHTQFCTCSGKLVDYLSLSEDLFSCALKLYFH